MFNYSGLENENETIYDNISSSHREMRWNTNTKKKI